ncbi:MAG: hypothetical protein ACRCZM_11880 [Bacteroidales bacterium]
MGSSIIDLGARGIFLYDKPADSGGGDAYSRSFCIQYVAEQNDPAVAIGGNVEMFAKVMDYIDRHNKPFECKISDGSYFSYLNDLDYTKRADGSESNLTDSEYFQGAVLPNFNIGYTFNADTNVKSVWINIDDECPEGFHRFIKGKIKGFARYNSNTSGSGASLRLIVTSGDTPSNGKSLQVYTDAHDRTNANLQELTYWEYTCLVWLAVAKLGTRNIQSVYQGLQSGATYGKVPNGLTDVIPGAHGQVTTQVNNVTSKPYKMWHLENPLHGDAWIELAGGITKLEEPYRYLYVTRDSDTANDRSGVIVPNNVSNFECKVEVLRGQSDGYCLDCLDYWTVAIKKGGSSTTGLCDSQYGINTQGANLIPLAGGASGDGAGCGLFCLYLHNSSSYGRSYLRGRAAMKI